MSRKVCTTGVVGSYSYLIANGSDGVVAEIRDVESKAAVTSRFQEMETAERWTERFLVDLFRNRDETD